MLGEAVPEAARHTRRDGHEAVLLVHAEALRGERDASDRRLHLFFIMKWAFFLVVVIFRCCSTTDVCLREHCSTILQGCLCVYASVGELETQSVSTQRLQNISQLTAVHTRGAIAR